MANRTPLTKFKRKLQNFHIFSISHVDILNLGASYMKTKSYSRRNSTRTKMTDSVFKKSVRIASVVALYW